MQDAHDPYAALRSRDYSLLLGSNVLAAMSAEIQTGFQPHRPRHMLKAIPGSKRLWAGLPVLPHPPFPASPKRCD